MKIKSILLILLVWCVCINANAQMTKEKVEDGIAVVERMIDAHKWKEAFAKVRDLESSTSKSPSLRYLVLKQRYKMYNRIKKANDANSCLQQMETTALRSKDYPTIEDMLYTKAAYYAGKGDVATSKSCYEIMFSYRSEGKNDNGKEDIFKKMISEADAAKNHTMKAVIDDLYTVWQDSISSAKAKVDLKNLKVEYANAQSDIESKQTKINVQWGTIVVLAILLTCVSIALVFMFLFVMRNIRINKTLRNSLKISNVSSAQKSVFMRNISSQISPSLVQIAEGNSRQHVAALQKMLADVEEYVDLDDSKEQKYEIENTNISKLCEEIVQESRNLGIDITTDAPKFNFDLNTEAVKKIISLIISETKVYKDTERITLSFKKRNPHTGQFTITCIGMRFSDEEKETMFVAFSKAYDLTQTSGLSLPICTLMANKMGGTLKIDEEFSKGTRFVLEIHC